MILRALVVAAALVALSGCTSGHNTASSDGGSSSGSSVTSVKPKCPANFQDTGHFLFTQKVGITSKGFTPVVAVAGINKRVVWTNRSTTTQSVYFDTWGGAHPHSPAIPPGGSWSWNPGRTGSGLYHSTYDPTLCGELVVQLIGNQ